jgi:chromate reductase
MAGIQVALVVGSLRKDSINRKLATAVTRLAPLDFTFKSLNIGDIPLYNQDHDNEPAASCSSRLSTTARCRAC